GLMTLSQALIGELVPPRERMRFQGYFALMFTCASIGGPGVGGFVLSQTRLRWVFFAHHPLAAFAPRRLARLPHGHRPAPAGWGARPGPVLLGVGAVSALFWLTSVGHRFAWSSTEGMGILALAIVTISLLVWHETRHRAPFLPIDLLRERVIALSTLLTAMFA